VTAAKLRGLWPYALILLAVLTLQHQRGLDLAAGPAPALAGTLLDGRPFDLAQLQGRPALVYFWASWCGVCKAMQHNIDALQNDVPMVSVALQSGDAAEVRRYLAEKGSRMPTLLDEDGALAARYGLRGVPAAFVLGPDGGIRYTALGYSTELGLRLRLWLARD
jgi:thiol-disulfide isomerase/thioredoxin